MTNMTVAKEAISKVRESNIDLRNAIGNLSLGELAKIISEETASKPVVVNVDVGINNEKGELVILKPNENLHFGIAVWATPKGMMEDSGFIVPDSICVSFMRHRVYFEVFSGVEDEHMDNNFSCIALACERNKIRGIFLLHPRNMDRFFYNTGHHDIAVNDVKDFLDEIDIYINMKSYDLFFLDLSKSSALDFHEYRSRCEIRDDMEI